MPKRKRKGREFTRQELDLVSSMIDGGSTKASIAQALSCSVSTVQKYFGDQLHGRHKPGRRPRIWTTEERDLVRLVVALGQTQKAVAGMLGISVREFQTAFSEELAAAKRTLDTAIGGALVRKALAGDSQLLRFYARSRMKWNDRADAKPEPDQTSTEADAYKVVVGKLDAEGRKAYRVVLEQLGAKSPLSANGPGPGHPFQ